MNSQKINSIFLLRGIAALLVVWDHLIADWGDINAVNWPPVIVVRKYITIPLAIIQDFGFLGVVFFFLISGFIISHVLQREDRFTFLIKRLFRIYPPFIISIIILVLFTGIYGFIASRNTFLDGRTPPDILLSMTLMNYFFVKQNPVIGVAWTLVIEIIFYALCFILLPLIQRMPRVAIMSLLSFCFLTISYCRNLGANFFLFSVVCSYLPFLLMGQIIYFLWSKRISFRDFLLFSAISYLIIIKGVRTIQPDFYNPGNSYLVTFMYAYLAFLFLIFFEKHIKIYSVFGFFSNISYSLYLYHGVLGPLILTILFPKTGFTMAIIISVTLVITASYLSWRLVETPSQQVARRILTYYSVKRRKSLCQT